MYELPPHIKEATEDIQSFTADWMVKNNGRIVTTPRGKFKGRPGVIGGAIFDLEPRNAGLHVLVMTLRADGSDVLNSISDSRSFWPIQDIPEFQ